jgi:FixJ family two-component response regulator
MGDAVVYVIDDNAQVRRALCRLLDSVNLSTEAFPSAEAFLAHPLPDQPSCLVLDLDLGNGRSGLDLQVQLGARQQTIPIIFITGTGSVRACVRAMKAGALDVLEKPVDPETLLERVRNALALSRQQVQAEAERRVIERRLARVKPDPISLDISPPGDQLSKLSDKLAAWPARSASPATSATSTAMSS